MDIKERDLQLDYIELCKVLVKQFKDELGHTPTCAVITFGCQMNARDSEKLAGICREVGFLLIEEDLEADFVIYNTCTVRDNASRRLFGRLGALKPLKKRGIKIALCGCLMQEEASIQEITSNFSYVDLVFGTHNIFKFPELLYTMLDSKSQIIDIWKETDKIVEDLPTKRKYNFKSGINIMYGCDNFCSYCIVPYVRGRERSRASIEIIDEIKGLVRDGVVEVMLLGQNVNSYGKGLAEDISFAKLLSMIEEIDGLERIRFMTSHPKDLSLELINVMKNSKKICRQLHLPLQSGSDRILKLMNRQYTKDNYLRLIDSIKEAMPDIALSTDIIVGFPTETAKDVDETIKCIEYALFDNAFTFIYSKRSGTLASNMEQLEPSFVKEQFNRVLDVVNNISVKRRDLLVGKTLPVLVEEINPKNKKHLTGRLSNGTAVHFAGDSSLIGKIVDVSLDDARGFYYLGTKI